MNLSPSKRIYWLCLCVLMSAAGQAQNNPDPLSETERKQVVEAIGQQLNDNYIFPEMAEKMAKKISRNLKKGSYDDIDDVRVFAQQLTDDLVAVSQDKHIRVIFDPEGIARQREAITPEQEQALYDDMVARNRLSNFGFHQVKIMEGNVGYLDLRSFQGTSYAGDTAVAAMKFLAHADALIIDLRKNGGGSPHMIQLLSSYLFNPQPVHLNTFYRRATEQYDQTWTFPHVDGTRKPDMPVYVLTSNRTFSAAEEFSYNLKNLERATLVGETTGGGAHPGGRITATDRFQVWVPTGRAINPITNTNWEGTGVSPHVEVPQTEALDKAYLMALDHLMANNDDERAQAGYQWLSAGLKAQANPVVLAPDLQQAYVGNYGPRSIYVEDGQLIYQRDGGSKQTMIPMGDHWFMFADIPYFRIQFEMNKAQAVALVGHYDNGRQDKNPRD
jgi:hypothetical protein